MKQTDKQRKTDNEQYQSNILTTEPENKEGVSGSVDERLIITGAQRAPGELYIGYIMAKSGTHPEHPNYLEWVYNFIDSGREREFTLKQNKHHQRSSA